MEGQQGHVPPLTFGIHGGRALALGPLSPAPVGLSPQFEARLPKKRVEGLPCPLKLILAAAWLPGATGAGSGCLHGNRRCSSPHSL